MKKNALDLSQKQRHLPGSYQRKTSSSSKNREIGKIVQQLAIDSFIQ